ncbi:MAG TPA: hypothetical protein VKV05_08665 [Terriglobales bacterium]|nr:hypothetical protein [Terriglobales bacterium]
MNRLMPVALVLVMALCVCPGSGASAGIVPLSAVASSQAQQQSSTAKPDSAQEGVIALELTKSLDSRKLKPGDPVVAKTMAELRTADGLLIPRGSKVLGHVTEATSRAKGSPQSSLGISFDKIAPKQGKEMPLNATIQAVGPPPNIGPAAMEMGNPSAMPSGGGMPPPMGGAPAPMGGAPVPMGGVNNGGLGLPSTNFPSNPSAQSTSTPSSSTPGSGERPAELTPQSSGVVGLRNLQLEPNSVLTSSGKEVKLESGSQILLRVQSQ